MGKVDLVRLKEPKFDQACWDAMSAVVEDIKANGPDAYKLLALVSTEIWL